MHIKRLHLCQGKLSAADPEGHVSLALTLSATARPEEALVHLRRALELAPEHLMAHRKLASILLELGRFEESVRACREGLAVTPTDPELHRTLESAQRRISEGGQL